ncbi:hypothetical protein D3C83_216610 [compost metagenome]
MIADPDRIETRAVNELDEAAELIDSRQPGSGLIVAFPVNGRDADLEMAVERQRHPTTLRRA